VLGENRQKADLTRLMPLSEEKRERLFSRLFSELHSVSFTSPGPTENEEGFTSRVVSPWLKNWVRDLEEPELYVRADGGPETLPLFWSNISLHPDLTITSNQDRYVAFEVKFLRNADPGGSMTKCIGQTFFYHFLDFDSSFGLVFDLRSRANSLETLKFREIIQITDKTQVLIFH
jgi:hypothetical protein